MSDFPLDDVTLVMLAAACEINPDSGHTELQAFLDMGARVKSATDITDAIEGHEEGAGGMSGASVYFVEFDEGYEPFSPNDAIRALVAEIQRLRAGGEVA